MPNSSILKKRCDRFLFSVVFSFLITVGFAQQSLPAGQIITDTITSEALMDSKLGDPHIRNMTIYLPPSYDSSSKIYPVIYLLHGHGGDEQSFVGDLGEELVVFLIDGMINEGLVKEMILVMPDGKSKYGGSYYLNSELTGNYEDYIVYEIVDYVDENYRTIHDRNGRAIAGASMGGYGSITLAMKHPDIFSSVVSLSPPLGFDTMAEELIPEVLRENPDVMADPGPNAKQYTSYIYSLSAALSPNLDNPPFFVDLPLEYPSGQVVEPVKQRWLEGDPFTMLSTYGDSLRKMNGIYIDMGNEDLLGFNAAGDIFHQELIDMGIKHEYNIFQGGHSDNVVDRAVALLEFLSPLLLDPTIPSLVSCENKLTITWGAIKR